MRTNTVLTILAIALAALFLPSAGAKAQPNVPILEVDTLVYLGKGVSGEAGGAFFLPDGNIIVLWKDTPLIIDAKSGEILRRLDALTKKNVSIPMLSKNGKYLIAYSDDGSAIWDVTSGKIIKYIQIANDYCFSPDGLKMYCTNSTSSQKPGIIRVYDMITLEEIERISLGNFITAYHIAISPDGQTLAVSVYRKANNEYDTKTNQVILIDLKDKTKYTVVEELEPSVQSMEFSLDGKQIMYRYIGTYDSKVYIYIYNLETKEKIYLNKSDIAKLHNIKQPAMYDSYFLNANSILIPISSGYDNQEYSFVWDIPNNNLKKIINFATNNIDIKNKSILLCSYFGALAILDSEYVSVNDPKNVNTDYLKYTNNLLEFNSSKVFSGQTMVYDTTGKLVANLGTQQFVIGKNIIKVNQPLMKGVYILTIKSGTEQSSYKFLVEN